MTTDNVASKLSRLKDDTWQLASEALEDGDTKTYRSLVDIVERLAELAAQREINRHPMYNPQVASPQETIDIFHRYRGSKYEAILDKSRIDFGTRDNCVLFQGKWTTPSGAANQVVGVQTINGWRLWNYKRDDGSMGLINELRPE